MTLRMVASVVCGLVVALTAANAGLSANRIQAPLQRQGSTSSASAVDPLQSLTARFPKSVTVRSKGHLLEFCPDNTCDAFVSARTVSLRTLRDFAYLYIFYFSDFAYLPEWRHQREAAAMAAAILQRPQYRGCRREQSIEDARCVLLDLSRDDRIKPQFVRYDEFKRNVVPRNLRDELAKVPSGVR
jgi:hypothetical protein